MKFFALFFLLIGMSIQAQDLAQYLSTPRNGFNSLNTVQDTSGAGMDGLQVQQENLFTYVGVYHVFQSNDRFCLHIATASSPTGPYTRQTTVDCDFASQGALQKLPDGRYLLAFEKNDKGRPYIQFRLYDNLNGLLSNQFIRLFNQPHVKGVNAQGTPNFRWIRYDGNPDLMTVEFGFHQNRNGRDVNAIGFLRHFKSLDYYINHNLNALVSAQANWHIGDRSFLIFQGRPYTVVEGMTIKNDFLSWRLFLHDEVSNTLTPLNLSTSGGSRSFGNGAISYFRDVRGTLKLLFNSFVFGPSPNPGQHIFITEFDSEVGSPIQGVSGIVNNVYSAYSLPHGIGRADGDGWSVSANERGHLSYGPYDPSLPFAPLTAWFSLMIDNNSADDNVLLNLDIYDADSGEVIANRFIRRSEFRHNFVYQWFHLEFDWKFRSWHRLEARVYSYGGSFVKMNQLLIRDGF